MLSTKCNVLLLNCRDRRAEILYNRVPLHHGVAVHDLTAIMQTFMASLEEIPENWMLSWSCIDMRD